MSDINCMSTGKPVIVPIGLHHGKFSKLKRTDRLRCIWQLYGVLSNGRNRMSHKLLEAIHQQELKIAEESCQNSNKLYVQKMEEIISIFIGDEQKLGVYKNISRSELLCCLDRLTLPLEYLENHKFLRPDTQNTTCARYSSQLENSLGPLVAFADAKMIRCDQCHVNYDRNDNKSLCVHHPRLYNDYRKIWMCCQKTNPHEKGCRVSTFHNTMGQQFKENYIGFYSTTNFEKSDYTKDVVALDCEMCYSELGLELCRISLLDFDGMSLLDTYVKPRNPIVDYNTIYSGITAATLAAETNVMTFEQIREHLKKFISRDTFIVGHGLDNDLRVLRMFHNRIIDTSFLFPHDRGLPRKRKLAFLAQQFLQKNIQNIKTELGSDCPDGSRGHDSAEDARAALELVKLKIYHEQVKISDKMPEILGNFFKHEFAN